MHGRSRDFRVLAAALGLTGGFLVAELVGAWWTNSLALLSDAAHMFTDVAALGLSLVALWVAARPPSERKTFGYHRAEILAAFVNGMGLCVVVAWIVHEAYGRFWAPSPVRSGGMIVIASGGLAVNVLCAWLLRPYPGGSLNLRGAFLHVLADLMGSIGAIVAGAVMMLTEWYPADALAALAISVLVLLSAWSLIRDALDVLMEAVPAHIDMEALRRDLEGVAGTVAVHDLHVWTLTTGRHALSAHAVTDGTMDGDRILSEMRRLLAERFDVEHVTIQLERARPCEPESVHV